MFLKKIIVGELETNCYIVADEKTWDAMIIDPGEETEKVLLVIEENHLKPRYIICTHGHPDHSGEVKKLSEAINVPVYIHKEDALMLNGLVANYLGIKTPSSIAFLENDQEINLGDLRFKVIHTPGHSKGGICLYHDSVLFSGDTLFAGEVGRMDLPGGSKADLIRSLKRLFKLPEDTLVYPGHGEETSIKEEKRSNPFLRYL
ncbi:MAG: MBL fold metallo-hydrolase [Candidatus Saganbacteria bacterium]|nr:MBL fold metallo-hydrolase [Candidatus Saganbacteria bacterium]